MRAALDQLRLCYDPELPLNGAPTSAIALFRHAEHDGRCPFSGAERKWCRPAATSPFDSGCVKTRSSVQRAELFSQFFASGGRNQYNSLSDRRNREEASTGKSTFRVFTQPRSFSEVAVGSGHFRFTPDNRHPPRRPACPKSATRGSAEPIRSPHRQRRASSTTDRKSTRLNSSHHAISRMPSSA